jgi:hypothetical protein
MNCLKRCTATVEGHALLYEVEGETFYGEDSVLLDQDDNLVAGTSWEKTGYTIAPFLSPAERLTLREGVRRLIVTDIHETLGLDASDLLLENYHRLVNADQHAALIAKTRKGWDTSLLPVRIAAVERAVSGICGQKMLSAFCPHPEMREARFYLRIVRPSAQDFNPPHRDVWLDRLRNAVNIYVPIAGSDKGSSLPLLPGSHRWKESDIERTRQGAKVNGVAYTVPSVTETRFPFAMTRPDPSQDEILVFTPYMIHGGGINANTDATRVSLEMRFWRPQ